MLLETIIILYAVNSVVIALAYLPQIKKLVPVKEEPVNFSFLSWSMWTYTSLIASIYAFVIVGDLLLTVVTLTHLVFCFITWALIWYKNVKYGNAK